MKDRNPLIRWVSCAALALLLFVAVGCRHDDDDDQPRPAPPSNIYEVNPDADPGTGLLRVYVFGGHRYDALKDVNVSLYLSMEDFDNDLFLDRGWTNRTGAIDFGYLNAGNYYVYATRREGETEFAILEPLQVQLGKTLTRNIVLY